MASLFEIPIKGGQWAEWSINPTTWYSETRICLPNKIQTDRFMLSSRDTSSQYTLEEML